MTIVATVDIISIVATIVITKNNFLEDDKMSTAKHTITDSEYEVMRILWKANRRMTVADVVGELDGNDWTPSTVSTFLQRLLKKGVVDCDKKGKTNLYYPKLKQSE